MKILASQILSENLQIGLGVNGKANISGRILRMIPGLNISNNGSGKLRLTKAGAFTKYEFYHPTNTKINSHLCLAINPDTGSEKYVVVKILSNNNTDYIDVDFAYSVEITEVIITAAYVGDAPLAGYLFPQASVGGKQQMVRVQIAIHGVRYPLDMSWSLWYYTSASSGRILVCEGHEAIARPSEFVSSVNYGGFFIDKEIAVPLSQYSTGRLIFLISGEYDEAEQEWITSATANINIIDLDYLDENNRMDLGAVMGQEPLSETNIAEVVDSRLSAIHGQGRWGTQVVAPSEV